MSIKIGQRLTRLEAQFPPVLPVEDPERGKQVLSDVRECLGDFGIDLDCLFEGMVHEFGQPSSRREFFIRFGIALADRPEAKQAVSVLLYKHLINDCGSN
jgi:hypothetical protein